MSGRIAWFAAVVSIFTCIIAVGAGYVLADRLHIQAADLNALEPASTT